MIILDIANQLIDIDEPCIILISINNKALRISNHLSVLFNVVYKTPHLFLQKDLIFSVYES